MKRIMRLPVIALRGVSIVPGAIMQLDISRPKSLEAAKRAMAADQMVFLVAQKKVEVMDPIKEDLYPVGAISQIKQITKMPNQRVKILIEALERGTMGIMEDDDNCLLCNVYTMELKEEPDLVRREAMLDALQTKVQEYLQVNPKGAMELKKIGDETDLSHALDRVAANITASMEYRQEYMALTDVEDRFFYLMELIEKEVNLISIQKDLQMQVKQNVDEHQKEYYLREQMKVIQNELGMNEESEIEEWQKKMEELGVPEEVKAKLEKEIKRYRSLPFGSQELSVIQNYIETMLDLPWSQKTEECLDLKKAEDILNADHYGLEKIKERVLEYLAVRKLNEHGESPILCLAGPPGTGKTSIAASLARAMNRKFVRISLGGVRDEADIRGHRKTYIGAMPGRIIAALRQAGVNNPIILLDEIDKMSNDYKGDPSSALLEVMDSEQNHQFRDHYLEVAVDLSNVLFIATANDLSHVPEPLYDRMEIVEVSSYTENEKYHIGADYLLPKQLNKHGLLQEQLVIPEDTLRKVIRNYTREAGVRGLERTIGTLCRKAAKKILEGAQIPICITTDDLSEYLGKERMDYLTVNEQDEVGIVRGLVWTRVGGDTLEIEANTMPGKGALHLTGQLGDVMKESANIALSYVRSIASEYGVEPQWFENHDIHIHCPEGAVPKDGPSAGVTMATAILSAASGLKVRADFTMTGEITLRGRVLPIGGLKEKILAARMAGFHHVAVPAKNQKDVAELSGEITGGLDIHFVTNVKEIYDMVLVKEDCAAS
ncbi:MAG: endopeptidase La [Lachnospiraceae bacterium]